MELELEASDEGSLSDSDSNHEDEENITTVADKSEPEVALQVQGVFDQIEGE